MAKRLQQGDVVAAVQEMRKLLVQLDTSAMYIAADYTVHGVAVERSMNRVRKPIDLVTERLVHALEAIEESDSYNEAAGRTT